MSEDFLYGWTVFGNPSDYPNQFVVRRWRTRAGVVEQEKSVWCVAASLEAARASIPEGRVRLDRHPSDDPVIVEVWL